MGTALNVALVRPSVSEARDGQTDGQTDVYRSVRLSRASDFFASGKPSKLLM